MDQQGRRVRNEVHVDRAIRRVHGKKIKVGREGESETRQTRTRRISRRDPEWEPDAWLQKRSNLEMRKTRGAEVTADSGKNGAGVKLHLRRKKDNVTITILDIG